MLRYVEEIVRSVEYYDLERFILEETDRELIFAAAMECGNDTLHTIVVTDQLSDYDKGIVKKFLDNGSYSYGTPEAILCYLCQQGRLNPGQYLISVSW